MDTKIGQIFSTKCGDIRILEEIPQKVNYNNRRFKIQFVNTDVIKEAYWGDIREGKVKNYNQKDICGVACLGEGEFKSNDKYYYIWKSIIHRCYNPNSSSYSSYGAKGIRVCEEWLNYQNFRKWIANQDCYENIQEYDLDKDILSRINGLENKIYSPITCLLIPKELNRFLIGDSPSSGVEHPKDRNYFRTVINYKGKNIRFGYYPTFAQAKNSYCIWKYRMWVNLLDKFKFKNPNLKDILLKYNFKWN